MNKGLQMRRDSSVEANRLVEVTAFDNKRVVTWRRVLIWWVGISEGSFCKILILGCLQS